MVRVDDTGPEEMGGDARNFRYPSGPLGEQRQVPYSDAAIGGTHRVSTRLNPEQALTGGYQPIEGDSMPPHPGTPYLPKN